MPGRGEQPRIAGAVVEDDGPRKPPARAQGSQADSQADRHHRADEIDYRFTLANERTFLAWQRTALGLLAAAVAVVQLVPAGPLPWVRPLIGATLVGLAIVTAGAGLGRWGQVDSAMRRGEPLPPHRVPRLVALGLIVVSLLAVVLMGSAGVRG